MTSYQKCFRTFIKKCMMSPSARFGEISNSHPLRVKTENII